MYASNVLAFVDRGDFPQPGENRDPGHNHCEVYISKNGFVALPSKT